MSRTSSRWPGSPRPVDPRWLVLPAALAAITLLVISMRSAPDAPHGAKGSPIGIDPAECDWSAPPTAVADQCLRLTESAVREPR